MHKKLKENLASLCPTKKKLFPSSKIWNNAPAKMTDRLCGARSVETQELVFIKANLYWKLK